MPGERPAVGDAGARPGAGEAQAAHVALAEAVRRRCVEVALAAYEDAGLQGLCADGRWEAAIGALNSLDAVALLHDPESDRPPR